MVVTYCACANETFTGGGGGGGGGGGYKMAGWDNFLQSGTLPKLF